jgi:hypothetical protein
VVPQKENIFLDIRLKVPLFQLIKPRITTITKIFTTIAVGILAYENSTPKHQRNKETRYTS